jgi:hypothetical protein
MIKEKKESIPINKVSYELVFLEAIMDCRRNRVNNPTPGFINAVCALELTLFEKERKIVEEYKYDYSKHEDEIKLIDEKLKHILDIGFLYRAKANELKKISWMVYCEYLDKIHDRGFLEDQDMNGKADKADLIILKYSALLEKIIDALKDGDWLTKGRYGNIGGGGIGFKEGDFGIITEQLS